MSLVFDGLGKLVEEMGELAQVAGKQMACWPERDHWDGSNLKYRLEEEIADVRAAISFVSKHFDLDYSRIADRYDAKRDLFEYWHNGGTEIAIPKEQPTLRGGEKG